MTQSQSGATGTANASTSTPIRISSSSSNYHGGNNSPTSTAASMLNSGRDSPSAQHSSSVPAAAAASAAPLGIGASNQSFGSITPPHSAGLRQSGGLANWATDSRDKYDGNQSEKTPDTSKLNRKESYKAQRKNYRIEKKRVASELLNSLQDPAVIVLADWLKVRGTLKSWTKLWCVLKPGLLLIYKSPKTKSSHWVGTVLLTSCQVIERPSKKDGFCFKLFHPLEQSIWAPRGPDKETIGAVVQPLPTAYLIFRAPSQAAGKCWMDALELSLRCSALLLRSNKDTAALQSAAAADAAQISHETQWSEADYEKHFNEADLNDEEDGATALLSGTDSDSDFAEHQSKGDLPETPYVPAPEEDLGEHAGEQVEELAEENKSLIWVLVKQVRPGMDLSKVVLPTFILEPRSFLDKLSDSYFHADILSRAVVEDDAFTRMKLVVQWYLSGFYKKPKGLKKPYNPILGETFRCYWEHPNGSRTFYIAEQVSHHPPISSFYVTNRQDGFAISCSILAKSKFYGNSTSAVLEGVATLTLLPRGEVYTLTTPYAHCKGILMGTLSMELGGKVNIDCENTGYKTELEFKLKPFLGGSDSTNLISGKIKLGKETIANINGHWDREMRIKLVKSNEDSVLFAVSQEIKEKRLVRHLVPLDAQLPNESEYLWRLVSDAIKHEDQVAATEQKTILEEAQRNAAKERKEAMVEWVPLHFSQDVSGEWQYKYADMRPWDPRSDVKQYESNYKVLTKTRHAAPIVRTGSVIGGSEHLSRDIRLRSVTSTRRGSKQTIKKASLMIPQTESDSDEMPGIKKPMSKRTLNILLNNFDQVNKSLQEHTRQLAMIQNKLERIEYAPGNRFAGESTSTIFSSLSGSRSRFNIQNYTQSMVVRSVLFAVVCIIIGMFFKGWLSN